MNIFDQDGPSFGDEILGSIVDHLSRSRLFESVPRATVLRCASAFTIHRIPAYTTLVLDGKVDRTVYVIRRGRVRLELPGPPGPPLVIAKLERYGAFGVETLVEPATRTRHAVLLQPTMLYSAPAVVLSAELYSCAQAWGNVAGILSEQLDGAALGAAGLGHGDLCDRVLAALKRVAVEHGVKVADGTLLDAALATDDVGVLARTSQENAATALFYLERADRIRTNGTSITLLSG